MKNVLLTRKEKIVLSTIDLINEIGIKELSIKEIAKKENITEAALYKHFGSKDEILIEVLEYYSKFDINISKTLENNNMNEKENILNYFKLYSEYYEGYPAVAAILGCYDVLLHENNIRAKLKEIDNQRTEIINGIIQRGQKSGDIRSDVDAKNIVDILFGTFERIIFRWRIEEHKFSLKDKTIESINEILKIF